MPQPTDIATWASLFTSLVALAVAVWAVKRGDDNSSGALVLATSESFRQAWLRIVEADASHIERETRDLLSLISIACAIHAQGSIHGQLASLLENDIAQALKLIAGRPILSELTRAYLAEDSRLQYILTFIESRPQLTSGLAALGLIIRHRDSKP